MVPGSWEVYQKRLPGSGIFFGMIFTFLLIANSNLTDSDIITDEFYLNSNLKRFENGISKHSATRDSQFFV